MGKTLFRTAALPALGVCAMFTVADAAPASADPPKTVVLEASGSGQALTIDIYDPKAEPRMYNQGLPFSHTVHVPVNSGDLFQIVAVPKGTQQPGCRILVNGAVVAEEPLGGSGQCIYTAP
jgi:Mycobacterium membrane protein